jgi:hypothetical protein
MKTNGVIALADDRYLLVFRDYSIGSGLELQAIFYDRATGTIYRSTDRPRINRGLGFFPEPRGNGRAQVATTQGEQLAITWRYDLRDTAQAGLRPDQDLTGLSPDALERLAAELPPLDRAKGVSSGAIKGGK